MFCPLKITQHTAIIVKKAGNKTEYTLSQGSPTLLMESYSPANFSSNPAATHLSVIIK